MCACVHMMCTKIIEFCVVVSELIEQLKLLKTILDSWSSALSKNIIIHQYKCVMIMAALRIQHFSAFISLFMIHSLLQSF